MGEIEGKDPREEGATLQAWGSYWRIGLRDMVFMWDGCEWIRSTTTKEDIDREIRSRRCNGKPLF